MEIIELGRGGMSVHVCESMWGSEVTIACLPPSLSAVLFKLGSHTEHWMRSFRDPTVLGLQMSTAMASFYVGDGNTESVPHARAADRPRHLSSSRTNSPS